MGKLHILGYMRDSPMSVIRQIMKVSVKALLVNRKGYNREELNANVEYLSLMYTRLSIVDLVMV